MIPLIDSVSEIEPGGICITGMPFDHQSSYRQGAAMAPARIREGLYCPSSNLWTETGLDLGSMTMLSDLGDLVADDEAQIHPAITRHVQEILEQGAKLATLGGDHAITYPIIEAFAAKHKDLTIVHLDAHPDLYDHLEGNRLSHACPFARIMENGWASHLIQIGIRTMNGHQREQAKKYGVTVYEMHQGEVWKDQLSFDGPVYLSIDLDCMDPGFAPGVSHFEPGGMTTRQVIDVIHGLGGQLVGADIVEYNPDRDHLNMTAMVAAKLLKEVIGRLVSPA